MSLSKPTNGANSDYANRIGLLFDEVNKAVDGESNWTPAITFATPGNLSVAYSAQVGTLTRFGRISIADFQVSTSSFTHTTASGNLRITGLPISAANVDPGFIGALWWAGITKANYTNIVAGIIPLQSYIELHASGSGQAFAMVTASDMPTGGSVLLKGTVIFIAA